MNKHYESKIDSMLSINPVKIPANANYLNPSWDEELYEAFEKEYRQYEMEYLLSDEGVFATLDTSINANQFITDSIYITEIVDLLEQQIYNAVDPNLLTEIENQESILSSSTEEIENIKSSLNRYKDKKNLKNSLQQAAHSNVIQNNTSLNVAHQKFNTLKKKYHALNSVRDVSTGLKNNALKDKKFAQRVKWGGRFRIHQGKELNIDLSPTLLYMVTRKHAVGLEFDYRSSIRDGKDLESVVRPSGFGARLYSDLVIYKSLFLHAELESVHSKKSSEVYNKRLLSGAMLGFGKEMRLSKSISGRVLFQYNFIHKPDQSYKSPWIFRFGFDCIMPFSGRKGDSNK